MGGVRTAQPALFYENKFIYPKPDKPEPKRVARGGAEENKAGVK